MNGLTDLVNFIVPRRSDCMVNHLMFGYDTPTHFAALATEEGHVEVEVRDDEGHWTVTVSGAHGEEIFVVCKQDMLDHYEGLI